jgi:hypothetical protein
VTGETLPIKLSLCGLLLEEYGYHFLFRAMFRTGPNIKSTAVPEPNLFLTDTKDILRTLNDNFPLNVCGNYGSSQFLAQWQA